MFLFFSVRCCSSVTTLKSIFTVLMANCLFFSFIFLPRRSDPSPHLWATHPSCNLWCWILTTTPTFFVDFFFYTAVSQHIVTREKLTPTSTTEVYIHTRLYLYNPSSYLLILGTSCIAFISLFLFPTQ